MACACLHTEFADSLACLESFLKPVKIGPEFIRRAVFLAYLSNFTADGYLYPLQAGFLLCMQRVLHVIP